MPTVVSDPRLASHSANATASSSVLVPPKTTASTSNPVTPTVSLPHPLSVPQPVPELSQVPVPPVRLITPAAVQMQTPSKPLLPSEAEVHKLATPTPPIDRPIQPWFPAPPPTFSSYSSTALPTSTYINATNSMTTPIVSSGPYGSTPYNLPNATDVANTTQLTTGVVPSIIPVHQHMSTHDTTMTRNPLNSPQATIPSVDVSPAIGPPNLNFPLQSPCSSTGGIDVGFESMASSISVISGKGNNGTSRVFENIRRETNLGRGAPVKSSNMNEAYSQHGNGEDYRSGRDGGYRPYDGGRRYFSDNRYRDRYRERPNNNTRGYDSFSGGGRR